MAIRGNKVVVPQSEPAAETQAPAVETPSEPKIGPDWEGNSAAPDATPEVHAAQPPPVPEPPKQEEPKAQAAPPAVKEAAAPPALKAAAAPTLTSLKDRYDPEIYGNTFPRLVGANGEIIAKKGMAKIELGKFCDIQVLSHSYRWMITPETKSMDDDAKKKAASYCRASYDGGKSIPDREGGAPEAVEDYVGRMQSETDFQEWKVTRYLDIFGIIFNAAQNKDKAEELGPIQVSVSTTAIKGFDAFFKSTVINVKRGFMSPTHQNCLRVVGKGIVSGNNNYTILEPDFVPKDILAGYEPITEDE